MLKKASLLTLVLATPLAAQDQGWKHTGDFGVSLTSGNSDTLNVALGIDSIRTQGLYTYSNEFDALYGDDNGETSKEQIANELKIRRQFPDSNWYAGASNDFLYDPLANIDYRIGTYALIGYKIIDNPEFKLRVEAGPGFVFEDRNGTSSTYASYKAAEYFDWQFSEHTKFFQSLKITGEIGDFANSIYTAEAGIESKLGGPWSVRLVGKTIHYGQTSADTEDTDHLILLGLGYSFVPGGDDGPGIDKAHDLKFSTLDAWVTTALIAGSYASGNTDSSSLAVGILSKRKTSDTSTSLGLTLNYGQSDGETSAESANFDAHHQYSFRKPYFAGLRLGADHDAIADLEYRLTLTPYIGTFLYEEGKNFLSIEAGPSLVHEKQGGEKTTYLAPTATLKAEKFLSHRTRLFGEINWSAQIDDFSNFILESQIGFDHTLTETTKLKVLLTDTYDNQPAQGQKSNDLTLITGLTFQL